MPLFILVESHRWRIISYLKKNKIVTIMWHVTLDSYFLDKDNVVNAAAGESTKKNNNNFSRWHKGDWLRRERVSLWREKRTFESRAVGLGIFGWQLIKGIRCPFILGISYLLFLRALFSKFRVATPPASPNNADNSYGLMLKSVWVMAQKQWTNQQK